MIRSVISRQRWNSTTYAGGSGSLTLRRWEIGAGKGQWRRGLRKQFPGVKVRVLFLGLASRYSIDFNGSEHAVKELMSAL